MGDGPAAMSRSRVAVVITHPIQHFSPAFREVHRRGVVDLTVAYWKVPRSSAWDSGFAKPVAWDIDLLDGYNWREARARTTAGRGVALVRQLHGTAPDVVVVSGWHSAAARVALLWALVARKPVLLYGDSSWQHHPPSGQRAVRARFLRVLFRAVTGSIATGTFNREFYIAHGMDPQRIAAGVYPFDVALYEAGNGRAGEDADAVVIGFAGKLLRRKGVAELLDACGRLRSSHPWRTVIIGDGPERANLEASVQRTGLADRVTFAGFRNQSEMPGALGELDILVVPSTEDYRVLVVAEAMTTGLAVVISSKTAVWGEGDLVESNRTGLVYRSRHPSELADTLTRLIEQPDLRRRLAEAGRSRTRDFGPDAYARTLEQAVITLGQHGADALYLTRLGPP